MKGFNEKVILNKKYSTDVQLLAVVVVSQRYHLTKLIYMYMTRMCFKCVLRFHKIKHTRIW